MDKELTEDLKKQFKKETGKSWHTEDGFNDYVIWLESKLQALKEEVDKLPINDFNSDVEWVKLDHIRNLITNLEDKQT